MNNAAYWEKVKQDIPSCWNCNRDWTMFHRSIDKRYIYGQLEHICPDCIDELPEDHDTNNLNERGI